MEHGSDEELGPDVSIQEAVELQIVFGTFVLFQGILLELRALLVFVHIDVDAILLIFGQGEDQIVVAGRRDEPEDTLPAGIKCTFLHQLLDVDEPVRLRLLLYCIVDALLTQ